MKKITTWLLSVTVAIFVCACGKGASTDVQETSTKVPAEATETPAEATKAPVEPTEVPAEATKAPVEPIDVPAGATKVPVELTKVPLRPTEIPTEPMKTPETSTGEKSEITVDIKDISTTDELETKIENHLDELISSLYSRWESLETEIDTYDEYCKNSDKVAAFYETVIDETNQMCIILYEYSAVYARMVLDSDMSYREKYKKIDGLNDCIYDDACDEISDQIYDGILEEMHDYFYEGILEDASDKVAYDKWYDISSAEYQRWYDASSEVYDLYYDTSTDIYSFYYDMSGKLYSGDMDRAEKEYEGFLRKIDRNKGIGLLENISPDAKFDTTVRSVTTIDDIESTVEAHVFECIQLLGLEWTTLSAEINTYISYLENVDRMEEFHLRIEEATGQILKMICEYGVLYAERIMQSELSYREKYEMFSELKDCIYEEAFEMVKDEIYDGFLDEIKDYYYDGIIYDAKDNVKYSDWSDSRSEAYSLWSDARDDVYDYWSDARDDVYDFCSDIRSELYDGDLEGANEELQDFKDKVGKMK